MNNGQIKQSRLAKYVSKRLDEIPKSQREVADAVGFTNQNMITMIKQGKAKLPLDRVPAMASVLDVDPGFLLRLAMEQFYDLKAVTALLSIMGHAVSDNEFKIIERIRALSGDANPELTPVLDECLAKAFTAQTASA